MQTLFATSFRPLRTLAQANVAVTPTTTPPSAVPAQPAVVPVGPAVITPIGQAVGPTTTGTSPVVWIVGGLLLAGAAALLISNANAPRRRR